MANTYYDSQLTAGEIEDVLEAINGILTQANNGKVLAISNGKIEARSVQWGGGGAVVQPLSVTQNGTYNPPSGVDGYSPVTVNVSGGGDDPFALVNYIESDGNQWINTGYIPDGDDICFELVANINSSQTGGYTCAFGARNNPSADDNTALWFSPRYGQNQFAVGFGFAPSRYTNGYYNNKMCLLLTNHGTEYKKEIVDIGYGNYTYSGTAARTSYPIYLFSLDAGGVEYGPTTRCPMKLYRFRIYEGTTLVHEFIPWQENGIACLKDTITGNIKYNAGTGNFVYGTDT